MAFSDRTQMLIGEEGIEKLANARLAVFGLGGVGGYCVEALARAGVGALTLIDADIIDETNINRQILATVDTVGRDKSDVAAERVLNINPSCQVTPLKLFYGRESADKVDFSSFDYVADCIDTVSSKLLMIESCVKLNVPIISCMGTGNKLDPSRLTISDISKTSVCPLAKVMRRELRNRGIKHLKVLFSTEEPLKPAGGGRVPGSISFVPSCAGLMIAGEIIRDLIKDDADLTIQ